MIFLKCPCNKGEIKVEQGRFEGGYTVKVECPYCKEKYNSDVRMLPKGFYARLTPKSYPSYAGYKAPENNYPDAVIIKEHQADSDAGANKERNILIEKFPQMELVKYLRKLENNTDDGLVDCMMRVLLSVNEKEEMIKQLQRAISLYDDYKYGTYTQREYGKEQEGLEKLKYDLERDKFSKLLLIKLYNFQR